MKGLTTIQSTLKPEETIGRLEAGIKAQGMKVFTRISHSALAADAGLTLRPTEPLIFGNPLAVTTLMEANQTIGIDLPQKFHVWQDAMGKTWLSCNGALTKIEL